MNYITFSAETMLYLGTNPHWDGIIEYSYDNIKWYEWNGEVINNNIIYMRGINNTVISNGTAIWHINGKNVKCQGNIENLLDYKSVINNIHPQMAKDCFTNMFVMCCLIEAPQLLLPKPSEDCYYNMFYGCNLLTISSMFPSFAIAKEAIINQKTLDFCPIKFININNKLYDINVLKLL